MYESKQIFQTLVNEKYIYFYNECRPIEVPKCKKLKNFYQCIECEDGYYMSNNKCV